MLNFSKLKIFFIYLVLIILSIFGLLNFQSNERVFFDKKINLGLDLQGGSYLLLEIDTKPLIKEKIQTKVKPLKEFLNQNNINFKDFNVNDNNLSFKIDEKNLEKFELNFYSKKDNPTNIYIDKYRSHELKHTFQDRRFRHQGTKYSAKR